MYNILYQIKEGDNKESSSVASDNFPQAPVLLDFLPKRMYG